MISKHMTAKGDRKERCSGGNSVFIYFTAIMDAMLKLGCTTWGRAPLLACLPSLGSGEKAIKLTVGPQIRGWGLEACPLLSLELLLSWAEGKKNALLVGILLETSEL